LRSSGVDDDYNDGEDDYEDFDTDAAINQSINHYSFNDKYFQLTQPQLE